MKLRILKFASAILMAFVGSVASASLLSVNLTTGGFGLQVDTQVSLSTHFEVCVYNFDEGGTRLGGLNITMDVSDTAVDFKFVGNTGLPTASIGGNFTLTLSDFVFSPPMTVVGVTNVVVGMDFGDFTSTSAMGSIIFTGDDLGDAVAGVGMDVGNVATASFALQTEAAPEPNALALLALALFGIGYARRRQLTR